MTISPKEFLKSRRPGQFSDSTIISESQIDSTILEFYLDTLANRSQEVEFERFGIRLCKAAITPNLVPNTGPTGGGDSKIDTETYPVSETTALGWITCADPKSAGERWGFAFSVQKEWGSKVRADVKKAYETGRGYKVAYFVSSRSIRAKDRARVEDELRKKYKIDVRILDRNWILKEVFENKREAIVKEELHVESITETRIKKGPLDLQKEEDLEAIDKAIEEALSNGNRSSSVVNDAIDSAVLSRELEKPRVEVDGRFGRAKRLAKEFGTKHQQFDVAYQFAWTTYWWHEDFPTYLSLYQEAEEQADPDNVYNLERLSNLWMSLNSIRKHDPKSVSEDFFAARTTFLKYSLEALSKDEGKPSASLYAKTMLLNVELTEALFSGQNFDEILRELKKAILESKGLVGYPFKSFIEILTEIGSALESSPAYDDLFNTILQASTERDGELSSAKLQLNRGQKLLELNRPHKAIQELGHSLVKLYKDESKNDAVKALFLIAIAYEQIDLLWVSRGALLAAASLATSSLWNFGKINTMQAACYRRLKWVELRLGRIPQALEWHHVDNVVRNILVNEGFDPSRVFEQASNFDTALGVLFLRSNLETLKKMEKLPDLLPEFGVPFSQDALFYALGYEDKLSEDFKSAIPREEVGPFFQKWGQLSSSGVLPLSIADTESTNIQITSIVMGCRITATVKNESPYLDVAESVLAAVEGFLATAMEKGAAAKVAELEIYVDNDGKKDLVELEAEDKDAELIIRVHCTKFNPHTVSLADQDRLKDSIFNIVAHIVGKIIIFKDPKNTLTEMMRDERVQDRALNFTASFVALGNVLGHHPKTKLSDWTADKKAYPVRREVPLAFHEIGEGTASLEGPPTKEAMIQAKHTDFQVADIIKPELWDRAKWMGVGYLIYLGGQYPPILAIIFEDIEVGEKIFSEWKNKIGARDEKDKIRVSIVQGINKKNPLYYRVGISANIGKCDVKQGQFFTMMIRMHTMTPQSTKNLDMFKEAYKHFGFYWFVPAEIGTDGQPKIEFSEGIAKREINFREAWEIGEHDPDSPLIILSDDAPIIPAGVINPPVVGLLKAKARYSQQ